MGDKGISKLVMEKYIYLTTRGRKTGKRHTVELWFAVIGDKIFLSHEGDYTDWMKNILEDDSVKFEIGGISFKGNARIVESGEVFEAGKHGLYRKYYGEASKSVIDDWFSESRVIEISMSD